jgi:hypothetical protein
MWEDFFMQLVLLCAAALLLSNCPKENLMPLITALSSIGQYNIAGGQNPPSDGAEGLNKGKDGQSPDEALSRLLGEQMAAIFARALSGK